MRAPYLCSKAVPVDGVLRAGSQRGAPVQVQLHGSVLLGIATSDGQ